MNFIQRESVAQILGGSMIAALIFMVAPIAANAQEDNLGYFDLGGGSYQSDYYPSYQSDYYPSYQSDYYPSYDSTYYPSYDSTYYPSYDSTYYPSYDSTYSPSYDSTYYPSYDSTYSPSYDSTYYPSYDSTYSPSYNNSYSPSYSPSYQPSVSSYPSSVGYPSSYYPTQTPSYPTPPRPQQQPAPSYRVVPIGQPTSIANYNTNENINENANLNENTVTSTNTNTSNSVSAVNNSGNSTNNINVVVNVPQQAAVTPIYQMPIIQYPVQYVYPQQQVYQAPYCTLTIQNNYATNQATLTWTSTNAISANISNIGAVNTSGSRLVTSNVNQVYTMTVTGQGGQSATCQATYNYTPTYVPPTTPAPYVSLSQIPYTGFDLGPVGNAIYWMTLLGFALAAAYLVVYYQGGALALATEMFRGRRSYATSEMEEEEIAPIPTPVVVDAPVFTKSAPTAPAFFNLPAKASTDARPAHYENAQRVAAHENVTSDSMDFYMSEDGSAPRIIITRN